MCSNVISGWDLLISCYGPESNEIRTHLPRCYTRILNSIAHLLRVFLSVRVLPLYREDLLREQSVIFAGTCHSVQIWVLKIFTHNLQTDVRLFSLLSAEEVREKLCVVHTAAVTRRVNSSEFKFCVEKYYFMLN